MSSNGYQSVPHDPQASSKLTTHLLESFDSEAKKAAYNEHVAKLHAKAGQPFEPIQIPPPPPELYQPRPEVGFGPQHGRSAVMAQGAAPPGNNFNQGRMSHPQYQQQNGARNGQQQQQQQQQTRQANVGGSSSYSAQSYTYQGPGHVPSSPPLVSVTDLPPEQLRQIEGMVYPGRARNIQPQESQPRVPNAMSFQASHHAPMFISQYSAQTLNRLQQRLAMKLGPEYISQRTGGGKGKLSYLEGWKAVNLANEVFGFNGWSSQVISLTVDYLDCVDQREGKYHAGASAIVRITLRDGTYHEDTGYGMIENLKGKGACLQKVKKEAVTDATKRALKTFGNLLGNCLYDKKYGEEVMKIKVTVPPLDPATLWRRPELDPTPNYEKAANLNIRPHPEADAQRHNPQRAPQPAAPNSVASSSAQNGYALPPTGRVQSHMQVPGQGLATSADASAGDMSGYDVEDYVPESFEEDFGSEAMAAAMDIETMDGPTTSDLDFTAVWKAKKAQKERARTTDGEMGPPAVPQSAKSVGGFRYPNPSSSHQVSPEKQSIKSGQSSPNKAGSGDLAGRKRMPDEDVDQSRMPPARIEQTKAARLPLGEISAHDLGGFKRPRH